MAVREPRASAPGLLSSFLKGLSRMFARWISLAVSCWSTRLAGGAFTPSRVRTSLARAQSCSCMQQHGQHSVGSSRAKDCSLGRKALMWNSEALSSQAAGGLEFALSQALKQVVAPPVRPAAKLPLTVPCLSGFQQLTVRHLLHVSGCGTTLSTCSVWINLNVFSHVFTYLP